MSVQPSFFTRALGVICLASTLMTSGLNAAEVEDRQEIISETNSEAALTMRMDIEQGGVTSAKSPITQVENTVKPGESVPVEDFGAATKTVPGQRLFTARYSKPLVELVKQLKGLATRLANSQIRAGGEVDGPLHILVELGSDDAGVQKEALLAFPTGGNPRSSGRFRTISTTPFLCAYRVYQGPAEGIKNALAEFARETEGSGHQLNGQTRLVFSCGSECTRENIEVELQLGIE